MVIFIVFSEGRDVVLVKLARQFFHFWYKIFGTKLFFIFKEL